MCFLVLQRQKTQLKLRKMQFSYVLSGASGAENTTGKMEMLNPGCITECREH